MKGNDGANYGVLLLPDFKNRGIKRFTSEAGDESGITPVRERTFHRESPSLVPLDRRRHSSAADKLTPCARRRETEMKRNRSLGAQTAPL